MERLLALDSPTRRAVLEELPVEERGALSTMLQYDWELWAREKQYPPPGDWRFWVILAGRGFGKTRTGAEWIRKLAESGKYRWLTIVGPTREAVRKIMLRGPAGIMNISPPWFYPKFEPSKLLLTWPAHPETGVICQARIYSAEKPERLRGEQHEKVWADEVAAWPKPESWEQIDMGLRLGDSPQALVTTTPRSTPLMVDLVLGPKINSVRVARNDVVITRGRSEENRANLATGSLESMRARYGDSRLGRQELDAELLEKTGAELWTEEIIRACRVDGVKTGIKRVVVAVDPTKANEPGDECGIVVAGLGEDGHAYVMADASVKGSPYVWASRAVSTRNTYRADKLLYEKNGLDRVEATMKAVDPTAKWDEVHASDGKLTRAEPVSALYEQGKVHHVGAFEVLEDEMVTWDPKVKIGKDNPSPNRMDALVHAITDLMLGDFRAPLIAR